ncbi:MAG: hypothetical protein AABN95_07855 [Acidobacteriota bacterium]
MQFFRFAKSGAALVDEVGGMIFGSLPGILMIYVWQRQGAGVAGATALILLLTGGFCFFSITRFGPNPEPSRRLLIESPMNHAVVAPGRHGPKRRQAAALQRGDARTGKQMNALEKLK